MGLTVCWWEEVQPVRGWLDLYPMSLTPENMDTAPFCHQQGVPSEREQICPQAQQERTRGGRGWQREEDEKRLVCPQA